jgi:hypothetical protein
MPLVLGLTYNASEGMAESGEERGCVGPEGWSGGGDLRGVGRGGGESSEEVVIQCWLGEADLDLNSLMCCCCCWPDC